MAVISVIRKPGFCVILLVTLIIGLSNIKPGYDFIGWDNYSSYLDPVTNISRTLSSWREYRGLGSLSDSEITDVPRQLFFLAFSIILPNQLLDQVYYFICLLAGVICMYLFAHRLAQRHLQNGNPLTHDLFAALSGFFYLFNLNTLAVFYFPIMPYVPRFFSIPLLFLLSDIYINSSKQTKKRKLITIVAILFSSTAYVIGTNFVTIMIVLCIFHLFQSKWKSSILIGLIFILMNFYWIGNFVQYSFEKSPIIKLSTTFIDANEQQLNKPREFYQLGKQLILLPNFFETTYSNLAGTESKPLHKLANQYKEYPYNIALSLFPILSIIGILIIFIKLSKHLFLRDKVRFKITKELLFLPTIFFAFLFLSMKEYSIFGQLYIWLDKTIPFFGVLFRFGDTKFHPYLSFSMSILSAFTLINVANIVIPKIKYIFIILIIVIFLIPYTSYLGNMSGYFVYNQIPQVYKDVAKIINEDKVFSRVLHVPYDPVMYWRSYSWGYLGSHFLGFMLNKPILEKTHEPASLENTYVLEKIYSLIHNYSSIDSSTTKYRIQKDLLTLLSVTSTKYIFFDGTVNAASYSRNVLFWGKYDTNDTKEIFHDMYRNGLLELVYESKVDPYINASIFEQLFSVNSASRISDQTVRLYRLKTTNPVISFATSAKSIDPSDKNILSLLSQQISMSSEVLLQEANETHQSFVPLFNKKDLIAKISDGSVHLSGYNVQKGSYKLTHLNADHQTQSRMVEIWAENTNSNLITVYIYHKRYPSLEGVKKTKELEDVYLIGSFQINLSENKIDNIKKDKLVLLIDGLQIPLNPKGGAKQLLQTIVTYKTSLAITVAQLDQDIAVNADEFTTTTDPNCLKDKISNYSFNVTKDDNSVDISSLNGSTCVVAEINNNQLVTNPFELELTVSGKAISHDESYNSIGKPKLFNVLASANTPLLLDVCVLASGTTKCQNSERMFSIPQNEKRIRVGIDGIGISQNYLIVLTVMNSGRQISQLHVSQIAVSKYKVVENVSFDIPTQSAEPIINIEDPNQFSLTLPYTSTLTQGFESPSNLCDRELAYRGTRIYSDTLISIAINCSNSMSWKFKYNTDSLYILATRYNLLSGRYPRLKVLVKDEIMYDEIVSRYQGYPDIKIFQSYRNSDLNSKSNTSNTISNIDFFDSYELLLPQNKSIKSPDARITFEQYTENEGYILLKDLSISELPNTWSDMILEPNNSTNYFDNIQNYHYSKVLPSLYYVALQKPVLSEGLLRFGMGYDNNWISIQFPTTANFSHIAQSSRCDGLVNCFRVSPGSKLIILLNISDLISLFSFIVSISTLLLFLKNHQFRRKHLSKN